MKHDRLISLPEGGFQIRSHAKLNLGLRIFPARPDGFHDLETWMVPISWHDTLTFQPIDQPFALEITGRSEGIPTDLEKNLAGRAAIALAKAVGIVPRGKLQLHKVLPPGGGIGGGSSNAANSLLLLNHAWGIHVSEQKLLELAAGLGSDVPLFVRNQAALCTGRGEIMTPLRRDEGGLLFAVLILPPFGCPTKEVYQAFDAAGREGVGRQHVPALPPTDWRRLATLSVGELNEVLVNDLEPAAFSVAPQLADLRGNAAAIIGQRVHMTGSGSTLFTLCDSGFEAGRLQARLARGLPGDCVSMSAQVLV